MPAGLLRNRYVSDDATMATPARLVTMLYDRLVLDLVRAESAQRSGEREDASKQLLHAQDIVLELGGGLRTDVWDGGQALLSLYIFVHAELVVANITGDAERTAACRGLVEPLRDAWHLAAAEAAGSGPAAANSG